jgi:hypothetical protein
VTGSLGFPLPHCIPNASQLGIFVVITLMGHETTIPIGKVR